MFIVIMMDLHHQLNQSPMSYCKVKLIHFICLTHVFLPCLLQQCLLYFFINIIITHLNIIKKKVILSKKH